MSEDDPAEEANKKRGLKGPLLIGVILAVVGGGGGFWAATSGPLASNPPETVALDEAGHDDHGHAPPPSDVAFIELDTLIITLGAEQANRNLIFSASLEVTPDHLEEVTQLTPRVLDVLNSYLRVIDIAELSEPTSLARLRAQMLRRIQVVTGAGRVHDLLVTQFLVN